METETERHRGRGGGRHTQREKERQRHRERDRDTQRWRDRETKRNPTWLHGKHVLWFSRACLQELGYNLNQNRKFRSGWPVRCTGDMDWGQGCAAGILWHR